MGNEMSTMEVPEEQDENIDESDPEIITVNKSEQVVLKSAPRVSSMKENDQVDRKQITHKENVITTTQKTIVISPFSNGIDAKPPATTAKSKYRVIISRPAPGLTTFQTNGPDIWSNKTEQQPAVQGQINTPLVLESAVTQKSVNGNLNQAPPTLEETKPIEIEVTPSKPKEITIFHRLFKPEKKVEVSVQSQEQDTPDGSIVTIKPDMFSEYASSIQGQEHTTVLLEQAVPQVSVGGNTRQAPPTVQGQINTPLVKESVVTQKSVNGNLNQAPLTLPMEIEVTPSKPKEINIFHRLFMPEKKVEVTVQSQEQDTPDGGIETIKPDMVSEYPSRIQGQVDTPVLLKLAIPQASVGGNARQAPPTVQGQINTPLEMESVVTQKSVNGNLNQAPPTLEVTKPVEIEVTPSKPKEISIFHRLFMPEKKVEVTVQSQGQDTPDGGIVTIKPDMVSEYPSSIQGQEDTPVFLEEAAPQACVGGKISQAPLTVQGQINTPLVMESVVTQKSVNGNLNQAPPTLEVTKPVEIEVTPSKPKEISIFHRLFMPEKKVEVTVQSQEQDTPDGGIVTIKPDMVSEYPSSIQGQEDTPVFLEEIVPQASAGGNISQTPSTINESPTGTEATPSKPKEINIFNRIFKPEKKIQIEVPQEPQEEENQNMSIKVEQNASLQCSIPQPQNIDDYKQAAVQVQSSNTESQTAQEFKEIQTKSEATQTTPTSDIHPVMSFFKTLVSPNKPVTKTEEEPKNDVDETKKESEGKRKSSSKKEKAKSLPRLEIEAKGLKISERPKTGTFSRLFRQKAKKEEQQANDNQVVEEPSIVAVTVNSEKAAPVQILTLETKTSDSNVQPQIPEQNSKDEVKVAKENTPRVKPFWRKSFKGDPQPSKTEDNSIKEEPSFISVTDNASAEPETKTVKADVDTKTVTLGNKAPETQDKNKKPEDGKNTKPKLMMFFKQLTLDLSDGAETTKTEKTVVTAVVEAPAPTQKSKENPKEKKGASEKITKQESKENLETVSLTQQQADPVLVQNGGDAAKDSQMKRVEKRQSLGSFFKAIGPRRMCDAEVQTDPVSILPAEKLK
ncbi:breast carcinoma-amplified sequence 1 isoform X2 [Bombina bombina]|uniref:breast carcinoma-amplified sequence 1 isoform X2 n=1 Tax=Bombina bombina TaxID=8345 RepID=UPI00235AEE7A|nr:breast carcinoma-amplified sequence 1 isoform X2 [Bombina bombina]